MAPAAKQPPEEGALVITYDVTEEAIAKLVEKFKGITFDTPENYEAGRKAIAELRGLRVRIENRRKELKADSLAFGRRVDAAAKVLTGRIATIEDPLQEAKDAIDKEEERKKKEAERAELIRLDEELRVKREADEAAAKEKREAEEKRLAEERTRLEQQQREQDERNRQEQERQAAERERLRLEEERLASARREIEEREATARREKEAREAAVRAEEDAKRAAAAAAAEKERLEAMKPDIEKVHDFGKRILALAEDAPEIETPECMTALGWGVGRLTKTAEALASFKGKL